MYSGLLGLIYSHSARFEWPVFCFAQKEPINFFKGSGARVGNIVLSLLGACWPIAYFFYGCKHGPCHFFLNVAWCFTTSKIPTERRRGSAGWLSPILCRNFCVFRPLLGSPLGVFGGVPFGPLEDSRGHCPLLARFAKMPCNARLLLWFGLFFVFLPCT